MELCLEGYCTSAISPQQSQGSASWKMSNLTKMAELFFFHILRPPHEIRFIFDFQIGSHQCICKTHMSIFPLSRHTDAFEIKIRLPIVLHYSRLSLDVRHGSYCMWIVAALNHVILAVIIGATMLSTVDVSVALVSDKNIWFCKAFSFAFSDIDIYICINKEFVSISS